MIDLDLRDFERVARTMSATVDQVPFALAQAMTQSAFRARELLITDTWPHHVEVRNRNFLRSALRVEPARKKTLVVAISETGPAAGHGSLLAHARGGTKRPRGKRLAIPLKGSVKRGARGVRRDQRPRAIIDTTPKRALRVTNKGIFIGVGGRLHLRYSFKSSAQIKPDVPFFADFNRYIGNGIGPAFSIALRKAMATRRL